MPRDGGKDKGQGFHRQISSCHNLPLDWSVPSVICNTETHPGQHQPACECSPCILASTYSNPLVLLVTLLLNLARPNSCKGNVSELQAQLWSHTALGLFSSLISPKHLVGSCPPAVMVLGTPRIYKDGGKEGKGWRKQHKEGVEWGDSSFKASPKRGYPVLLKQLAALTWMARETPKRLEETQASRLTSVQLLFSGFTWYTQRSSTTCMRHDWLWALSSACHRAAHPPVVTYHETCVVDVPGECGHGSVLEVHDRVLQDVDRVGDVGWEEALCPARHPVGLGEEPPGEQLVVRRHLPVHDVFSQDMFANMRKKTSAHAPSQECRSLGATRCSRVGEELRC